jgi:hypothetical protein
MNAVPIFWKCLGGGGGGGFKGLHVLRPWYLFAAFKSETAIPDNGAKLKLNYYIVNGPDTCRFYSEMLYTRVVLASNS